jgi:dienelactone hydrolase
MAKTITIYSSTSFYKHVNEIADELREKGYMVVVPQSAEKMRKGSNYDIDSHKTWYQNPADFACKRQLMDDHFAEVAKGDICLVVNDEKHGVPGYIGPKVLM